MDCAIDHITCGNNHVVAYNTSLNKLFFWGSNKRGQIEIYKKENIYKKPKGLSLGPHVTAFKVEAKGDSTVLLTDSEVTKEDLEMVQVPKEDILGVIHELGSRLTRKVQLVA